MVKGRRLLSWAGILLLSGAASFYGIQAQGEKEPLKAAETGRPDLIKIDTLAAYQKLELPPVTFSHDKHTKALREDKQDCTTCHLVENGKLSLAYMRRKNTQAAALKEIYHANCIGCHMERAAAGKKTGPPDGLCRACHNAQPQIAAVQAGRRAQPGIALQAHRLQARFPRTRTARTIAAAATTNTTRRPKRPSTPRARRRPAAIATWPRRSRA